MAPNRSRHWPALPQGQPCVPFRWLRALWEVPGLVAESSGLRPSGEGVPCSWAGAGASLCPVSAATAPCRHICAPLLCGTRAPAAQLADSVGCPSWAWRLCPQHPSPHQTLLLGAPPPPSPAPALEFAPPLRLFRHLGGGVLAQPTVGSLVGPERLRPAGASGLCLGAGRRYKQSSGTGRLSQCHSSPQGLVLVSSPLLMEETGTERSVNLPGPRSK